MKHTPEQLIEIVHQHYPRGIQCDDPRYKRAEETKRLVATRKRAGAEHGPWRAMLSRLGAQFPEASSHNFSLHLPMGNVDAGYVGCLSLECAAGEHHHAIDFSVSFLAPYYTLSSSRVVDDDTPPDPRYRVETVHIHYDGETFTTLPADHPLINAPPPQVPRKNLATFALSPQEEPYAAAIAREIEATWGYERLPPEVGMIVVPDVSTNLTMLGEATLHDCLFCDRFRLHTWTTSQ